MTKKGLNIQTILTKQADLQAEHVLLLEQLTEKKEKAYPSHFLKFLLAISINGTFGLPNTQANPSLNQKSRFYQK